MGLGGARGRCYRCALAGRNIDDPDAARPDLAELAGLLTLATPIDQRNRAAFVEAVAEEL
jgi:hypothetical protein